MIKLILNHNYKFRFDYYSEYNCALGSFIREYFIHFHIKTKIIILENTDHELKLTCDCYSRTNDKSEIYHKIDNKQRQTETPNE